MTNISKIRSIAKRGFHLSMRPRDWLILRRLENNAHSYGSRLGRVLTRLKAGDARDEGPSLSGIEDERVRMLARNEPLVDGSLGRGGIYDDGVSVHDACKVSKPQQPALLMYLLVREFSPRQIIELGTNVGISSAYQATALRANGLGRLVTLEASPYRIRLASKLHASLGLDNISYVQGLFGETLASTLKEAGEIDFAFIDGHHQYQPTLDYTDQILKYAAPEAILVFDDIRWSEGMKKAWRELRADRRFQLVVDLHGIGICVRSKSASSKRQAFPTIYHAFARPNGR